MSTTVPAFNVLETTIDDIHGAYKSSQLTARQLVQTYLNRIEAYNKQGPAINAIITLNPNALDEARHSKPRVLLARCTGFRSSSRIRPMPRGCRQLWARFCLKITIRTETPLSLRNSKRPAQSFWRRPLWVSSVAATPMAPCPAQPETLTILSELLEAHPAVPERASPQTSAPRRSGKKVLRRSVALRPGTPSPECGPRPAL